MEELKKEYVLLFNGISETITHLEETIVRLECLQREAEQAYLEHNEEPETGTQPEEKQSMA